MSGIHFLLTWLIIQNAISIIYSAILERHIERMNSQLSKIVEKK